MMLRSEDFEKEYKFYNSFYAPYKLPLTTSLLLLPKCCYHVHKNKNYNFKSIEEFLVLRFMWFDALLNDFNLQNEVIFNEPIDKLDCDKSSLEEKEYYDYKPFCYSRTARMVVDLRLNDVLNEESLRKIVLSSLYMFKHGLCRGAVWGILVDSKTMYSFFIQNQTLSIIDKTDLTKASGIITAFTIILEMLSLMGKLEIFTSKQVQDI